jgi:hypothetical protein
MRLYHFTKAEFGLQAIRDRRLKISELGQLNDPFEFLGIALANRYERKILRQWKESMAKEFGILCMSGSWQQPLLWSHYADRHCGMCLGFDAADDRFIKVKYVPNRPTLATFGYRNIAELDDAAFEHMVYSKFDAWVYEDEYRSVCGLGERDEASGLCFVPFSEHLILREVIVGAHSLVTRAQVADVLRGYDRKINRFKARVGFKKFEVVEQKEQGMWI